MTPNAPLSIPSGATLPVLMYHSVTEQAAGDLEVSPARLREQLGALHSAGYRLTGLTQALGLATREVPVVAVTFDDAYWDFRNALPILAEFDASATLYVPVGDIGGAALGWSELHEAAQAGVEIGNHSLVHEPLDVLPTAEAQYQITISRERLAAELDAPIDSFAYPHGYHSAKVRAAVEIAGHQTACEVGRRICRPSDERFAIPRLQPTQNIDGERLLRMVGGEAALMPAVKRLAQPGWRLTRRLARTAGLRLT